jgi:hypothetical protein
MPARKIWISSHVTKPLAHVVESSESWGRAATSLRRLLTERTPWILSPELYSRSPIADRTIAFQTYSVSHIGKQSTATESLLHNKASVAGDSFMA